MSWQIDTLFISDVETLPPFLNVTRMVREQQRCLTRFPRRNAYFPRELLRLISCSDLALANIMDACAVLSVDAVWTENIKTIWLNIIVLKTDFIFTILFHYTKQACILNTLNTLLFFWTSSWFGLSQKKPYPPPVPRFVIWLLRSTLFLCNSYLYSWISFLYTMMPFTSWLYAAHCAQLWFCTLYIAKMQYTVHFNSSSFYPCSISFISRLNFILCVFWRVSVPTLYAFRNTPL